MIVGTYKKVALALLSSLAIVALFILNAEPYIRSDGYCYWHIARSIVDQGSFISVDRPDYWDYMGHVKTEFEGKYISVCAPGTGILLVAPVFVASVIDSLLPPGSQDYFLAYNGHTLTEGVTILLFSLIVFFITLTLIYRTLRTLEFSRFKSLISLALIYASSYAVWYVLILSTFTHTYEMFSVSLTMYGVSLFLKAKHKYAIFIVASGIGLSILIRPTLLFLGVGFFIYLILKRDVRNILRLAIAGLPFASIYMLYNAVSYGGIFKTGYTNVWESAFTINEFNGLNILFSSYRGWLVYSPIFILSLIGLVLLYRRIRTVSLMSLLTIFGTVIIYGFWEAWWGGGSFGSRFLIFAVPFGAIGLAELWQRLRNYGNVLLIISILLTAYSVMITGLYRVTSVENNPNTYTPLYLIQSTYEGLTSLEEGQTAASYLIDNLQTGSGLLALLLGRMDYAITVKETDLGIEISSWAPPISSQTKPTRIPVIAKDNQSNEIFEFEISGLSRTFIACEDKCDFSAFQTVDDINGEIVSLPVSRYTGILLDRWELQLYFELVGNVQFKGNIIPWDVGSPSYVLKSQ